MRSRMALRVLLFFLSALIAVPVGLSADILVMKNGNKFEGQIVEQTDEQVVLKVQYGTQYGTMTFRRSQIKEIKKVRKRTPPPPPTTPGGVVPKPPPPLPSKPGEHALQYSPKGFPMGLSTGQGRGLHLCATAEEVGGLKKLPPETGATRSYGEFTIAGQMYVVMIEEANPAKFYIDANRNGDLTDDPGPFPGEKQQTVANQYDLKLPYEGKERPVSYRMWAFGSRMGGVRFYARCHWYGHLSLKGRRYKMVLFDATPDCDYSNEPLIIDINGDGEAGEGERLKTGESLDINGIQVTLESIAPSGRRVHLKF